MGKSKVLCNRRRLGKFVLMTGYCNILAYAAIATGGHVSDLSIAPLKSKRSYRTDVDQFEVNRKRCSRIGGLSPILLFEENDDLECRAVP
jgi:hypothetical protein